MVTFGYSGHQEDCQAILSPREWSRIFADALIVIALFVFGGDVSPFSSCGGGEDILYSHHLSPNFGVSQHAMDVLDKI